MRARLYSCLIAVSLTGLALPQAATQTWSSWRGRGGTGSAPRGNPPVQWSATTNVKWQAAIPGLGSSSPVIWGETIYLCTAIETDREGTSTVPPEPQNRLALPQPTVFYEYRVLAVDRRDGAILWNRLVTTAVPHEGGHSTNTHASASPVTDGGHVFVNFGSRGLYCLDSKGEVVWSKELGAMRTRRQYGEAISPALHGDRLIVNHDHEGDSFVAVFDKRTGDELWRKKRDEVTSWSTPIVVAVDGRPQVIVSATGASRGYDLETGAVVWSLPGNTVNTIPHPIHQDGVVFLMSGYRGNNVQAVRLAGAAGDLTESEHVLWSHGRSSPYVPSATLHRDRLYFLRKNSAVLSCLDAATGAVRYEGQRLAGLRTVYSSPVAVADRVYVTSRDGVTCVLRAGDEFEQLASNDIGEPVDASIAIIGDEIYLRGRQHLFCIAGTGDDEREGREERGESRIRQVAVFGDADARTAALSVGDLDGDGDLDLIAANGRHWPGQNRLFRNAGAGRLEAPANLSTERSTSYAAELADLDGDGDLDVVVGNDKAPSYVLWSNGAGGFTRGPTIGELANTRSVTLADLDGRNGVDVVFVNRRAANLICWRDADGGFTRTSTFGGSSEATIRVAAGDVDRDGDVDLVAANRNGQPNFVFFNDGDGRFEERAQYGTGSDSTRGVTLADVDGDGTLDILNANIGEPNAVWFGDGKGGFGRGIRLGGDDRSFAVTAADLNGDGRLDVIVANAGGANVAYLQTAMGGFEAVPFGDPASVSYGVLAADLDGDGRPEIATANSDGPNFLFAWHERIR